MQSASCDLDSQAIRWRVTGSGLREVGSQYTRSRRATWTALMNINCCIQTKTKQMIRWSVRYVADDVDTAAIADLFACVKSEENK